MPGGNALDNRIDTLAVRLMRQMRELQVWIARACRLEADDAGENPPVDLWQHHMHREIGRRQAAKRGRPVLARRRSVIADRREGGCIDDHSRRLLREMSP